VIPPPKPDVLAVALDVAYQLEAVGVRYVIGGSLASSVHGEPRATLDVDLVADLRASTVGRVVAALERDYYVDGHAAHEAVRLGTTFNLVHLHAGVKVDVFVAGDDDFDHERLRTRVAVPVPPPATGSLWFDTAEHTLLRKLEWYRRGGEVSERQWRDVAAIVALQEDALDRTVLDRWAPVLGVSDLLARLTLR